MNSYCLRWIGICWSLLSLFGNGLFAQIPPDTLFEKPLRILENLPAAQSIEVDPEGNLILLETSSSRIHKYLVQWEYDSALSIGGKSSRSDGFLHMVNASARNRQHTYVLDDVAQRLVILSVDFQVVGEMSFFALQVAPGAIWEATEIYPLYFDLAPTGETFVLNQLDNRVYKLNLAGEVIDRFGGLDYGSGSLLNPVSLALNDQNEVWVCDTSEQAFYVFDYFGVFRYQKNPDTDFRWRDYRLAGELLICFDTRRIYTEHLPSGRSKQYELSGKSPLLDVHFSKEFIYLLFEKEVHIHLR